MAGARKRAERTRENVWFSAMLSKLEKVPSLEEFSTGRKDNQAEIVRCIAAWDKLDRALARSH